MSYARANARQRGDSDHAFSNIAPINALLAPIAKEALDFIIRRNEALDTNLFQSDVLGVRSMLMVVKCNHLSVRDERPQAIGRK